ncbi:MAG: hypothetical protein ABI867_15570 [Kofleriaceae bacterium]
MRLAARLLFIATLAGCGSADDRAASVEVISLEILLPSCGAVQCHSTTTRTAGYAFDTLEEAKASLRDMGVSAGNGGELLEVIDDKEMPPDSPMFEADVALIEQWIADGAQGL